MNASHKSEAYLMNKTLVYGELQALQTDNPLQTKLRLIITDFSPNNNKIGVPKKEAANIVKTALFQPFKINFNGIKESGHKGAWPVGTIISAQEEEDKVVGEAIVWNHEFPEVAAYLKEAFASTGVRTSWEIFYDTAEKDENDIGWLEGTLFGGTCVVEIPAYDNDRTRVLAIAETERMTLEELQARITDLETQLQTITTEKDTAVSAKDAELQALNEKLTTYQEADNQRALAEKTAARKSKISTFGIDFDAKADSYMGLTDEAFELLVTTLAVAKPKVEAEDTTQSIIPQFPAEEKDLKELARTVGKSFKNRE